MNDAKTVLLLIIIVVIIYAFMNNVKTNNNTETFINTQNYPYTNKYDIANYMTYGENEQSGFFDSKPSVYGPSNEHGVNENSKTDIYDNRGYKWSKYGKDPRINILTNEMDNEMMKQKFNRMYSLDPNGNLAKYDISNMPISPHCCPATYAPPFDVGGGPNCDYANKYVANNYSGMNYSDGLGCVCMTPNQAEFYGARGGNA